MTRAPFDFTALATPAGGTLVDLTLLLAEELPTTWPGHMPYQHKTFNYFQQGGPDESHLVSPCGEYQTRWLLIDEHTGTHVDAPAHFIPRSGSGIAGAAPAGDITVDKVPLEQTFGAAVVVDVSELLTVDVPAGHSPDITPAHVTRFEAEHGPLAASDIVLFRSGWDQLHYRTGPEGRAYAHGPLAQQSGPAWPAPTAETLSLLLDRGVRCVGTDGPSMGSSHAGRDVHLEGLGNGCVFVEALACLHLLPVRGALFVFAPLKIARGTGAPGRALAVVPAA